MGVGAGLYMCDVVKKKVHVRYPGEFLLLKMLLNTIKQCKLTSKLKLQLMMSKRLIILHFTLESFKLRLAATTPNLVLWLKKQI